MTKNSFMNKDIEEQITKYINNQPEPKHSELQELHQIILHLMPPASMLWFLDGKNSENKIVSNPNIGYGVQTIKYSNGKTRKFYQIGLSANTTGISVYVLGIKDKKYLVKTFGKKLGKASVSGYCIKFKKLKDINIDILEAAIRYGIEAPKKNLMQNLQFSIMIKSPKEKVWKTLWEDKTFRDWTNIIDEGMYLKGALKEGNEVQFLSPSGYGVTSLVERLIANEFVLFRHRLDTLDGLEREKEWTGGTESYSLKENRGVTTLTVEVDVLPEQEENFKTMLPKALKRVKILSEKNS